MANRRVGVYVDSMNIMRSGGYGMRYEVIRRFAARDGDEVMRLNAYVAIDEERAVSDPNYKTTLNFILTLRDLGFKAVEKAIRWYTDDSGRTYGKANLDMEMGLDIVSQSDRLDLIYLFTGDGDFCSVVTMAQNKGCRVELIAFANVSGQLRREVDLFVPGYLMPGLVAHHPALCGGSRLGGSGQPGAGGVHQVLFGPLLRLFPLHAQLRQGLDYRHPPGGIALYLGVFYGKGLAAGDSSENLPSRDYIFEFTLSEGEKGFVAADIELIYKY